MILRIKVCTVFYTVKNISPQEILLDYLGYFFIYIVEYIVFFNLVWNVIDQSKQ